jgi:apolipoprotein N-acyltransferase
MSEEKDVERSALSVQRGQIRISKAVGFGRSTRILNLLLCISSGLLLILSFPRFGIVPCAWIALVPWLLVMRRVSFKNALLCSLVFGFVFFAGLLYWVALFGYLPWILLALFQALFIIAAGLGIWLLRNLRSGWRILGTAAIWTIFEWLRGQGIFGFTWGWLGYSQSSMPNLIQMAAFTGVPGITFLMVLHNAALAEVVSPFKKPILRRLLPLALIWMLFVAVVLLGAVHHSAAETRIQDAPTLRVAIIQPNFKMPQPNELTQPWSQRDAVADFAKFKAMTRQAAAAHPDLIIGPESAMSWSLDTEDAAFPKVSELAREAKTWLLLGSPYQDEARNTYNSAYLFSPGGKIAARYDKVQLVPFSEFVPGRKWLPGIRHYPVREFDFAAGKSFEPISMNSQKLGVAICFESIFPRISRALVNKGAEFLVIITNDGWFGQTAAAAQHRQMAVFRAVETRAWVARAAASGISCFIAPSGRIVKEIGLQKKGIISAEIWGRGERENTFYVKHGDWFVIMCALIAVICLGWVATKKMCRKNADFIAQLLL